MTPNERAAPEHLSVEQACAVWREHEETLQDYEQLRRKLNRLDRRFWKLKESIAALYARTHA